MERFQEVFVEAVSTAKGLMQLRLQVMRLQAESYLSFKLL